MTAPKAKPATSQQVTELLHLGYELGVWKNKPSRRGWIQCRGVNHAPVLLYVPASVHKQMTPSMVLRYDGNFTQIYGLRA